MTDFAIKVEGLWKEYVVGKAHDRHTTLYELLARAIKAPAKRMRQLRGDPSEVERFWALHDISFEVLPGEVLGVIGRNGAGKSTLLKILSRITAPTRGRVLVKGRMSALLEVGTGFHPELSGRENIYLNGALLGMSRAEITRRFTDIVDFAEIEKFIDTPVKRYSSGMYVRLAFAVAAHLDPDILVIDEVLAVGDFEFQKKCLGKMKEVSGAGRTVLFVSHNMPAVQLLCSKVLLLDQGHMTACGASDQIVRQYISNVEQGLGVVESGRGTLAIVSAKGTYEVRAGATMDFSVCIVFEASDTLSDLIIDFGLEDKRGVRLMQIVPHARGVPGSQLDTGATYAYRISAQLSMLAPGEYFGTVFAHSRSLGTVLHQTNISLFSVAPLPNAPECMTQGFTALLVPNYSTELAAYDPAEKIDVRMVKQ